MCAGKRLAFEAKGEHSLKGFPEPVSVYEVRFQSG
jgi:class 3 adenylate cyclase